MGRARDRASADLNGQEFILDADADTSISADTDDQIDIKIAGADDFQFTANTFTAQSGSTIAAQALTATTITATGDVSLDGGNFVFNESSADVDFRLESDSQGHAFFLEGSTSLVGIGVSNPADYNSYGNGLVIDRSEQSNSSGITLVSGTSGYGSIYFSDATGNVTHGAIEYGHGADLLKIKTGGAESILVDANGHVTMPKQPASIAYSNVNNTVTFSSADTYEIVTFNTETIDKNADYSPNTFTAPVDGTYYVNANVMRSASSSGSITYDLAVYVNSALTLYSRHHGDNSGSNTVTQNVTGLVDLDASDTVQVYARVSDTKGTRYQSQVTTYFHVFLLA